MPEISVVIPTLGNYAGLARVLESYERQRVAPGSFEVIVVADAADPDPAAVEAAVGERPYPLRLLRGRIRGVSSNRNIGWRAATAPLVLFTDNDTVAEPQLLGEHLAWQRRHPEEGVAVLGHVRWARQLEVTPFMHWLDHGIQFDYPNIRGIEAGWGRFYSANVSVKRSLVERVRGFDEERMPYLYEDLDFAIRAREHGLRVLYNRKAVVEHLREMDLEFWRSKMARLAMAERTFVGLHPEVAPFFHRLFSWAARMPPARGRGRHLIKRIPRRLPVLGPAAWRSADLFYAQALAPYFLAGWERAGSDSVLEGPVAPYLLERDAVSSSGSDPGGP